MGAVQYIQQSCTFENVLSPLMLCLISNLRQQQTNMKLKTTVQQCKHMWNETKKMGDLKCDSLLENSKGNKVLKDKTF